MLKFFKKILDWLFPITCAGCGQDDLLLCEACRQQIVAPEKQLCPRCRRDSEWGLVCPFCWESALRGVAVAFNYSKDGMLAKMLHLYKYGGMTDYGAELAKLLNCRVQSDFKTFMEDHFDLITWTPLSRKKLRLRGFNQTERLAKGLDVNLPRQEMLIKVRESRPQMELDRRQRLENLKGAFAVSAAPLAGKRILVVDDVATTLATLEEIAETLRQAGAAVVYGLVLARQM